MEKTLDILRHARKLITARVSWTKGTNARNNKGQSVFACVEDACRFCLLGSINAACHQKDTDTYFLVCQEVAITIKAPEDSYSPSMIALYNDNPATTHAMALKALDDTLERLAGA